MLTLESECYTIELGKVVKHKLRDFERFVSRDNNGAEVRFAKSRASLVNRLVYGLYATNEHGRAVHIHDVATEADALQQLTAWEIEDIINNATIKVYLTESEVTAVLIDTFNSY